MLPVHILPENLVSGAINVANLARNATESIIRSLHNNTIPLNIPLTHPPPSGPNTPDFYQNIIPSPQSPTEAIPMPPPVTRTPVQEAIPLPPPPVRSPIHTPLDTPYLKMLHEMGFTNHNLNAALLIAHCNNLSEVVAELLSMQQQN
ncbi:hypothetical protein B566_EDAN001096 [Ephemera danica]|nr:hypothetical protein B566_EDAN001096 [Ephemera danica]